MITVVRIIAERHFTDGDYEAALAEFAKDTCGAFPNAQANSSLVRGELLLPSDYFSRILKDGTPMDRARKVDTIRLSLSSFDQFPSSTVEFLIDEIDRLKSEKLIT